jgi:hypothetical protein
MGWLDDITGRSGASAARQASDLKYRNQVLAAKDLEQHGANYATGMGELSEQFSPYVDAGGNALQRLLQGLGLGGEGGSGRFADSYRALPGYEAGLSAGTSAIDRSAASRGMSNSGATLKALSRFGSDYEDQRSGNYMNRLASLVNTGQSATGSRVSTAGQGLQGQLGAQTGAANMMYGGAGTQSDGIIAAQNAHNAGSQNMLNLGTDILGKIAGFGMSGGFGGGTSSFGGGGGFYGGSPDTNPLLRPF